MPPHPSHRWSELLLALALALLVAAGAGAVESEEGPKRTRISELLDADVADARGGSLGTVHDLFLAGRGRLLAVVVERPADGSAAPVYQRIAWSAAKLRRENEAVRLAIPGGGLASLPRYLEPPVPNAAERSVVRLLGYPVRADRTTAFGRIEDLLLTESGDRVAAFVIAPDDGPERRVALRWDASLIREDGDYVAIPAQAGSLQRLDELVFGGPLP